ncbi:MAG TPA: nidogen-like domain-containing protein [Actinomycetales bacterium]|nr:nidogen-like domain-containing protein [Actinomycetales bacterium]
MRALVAAAIGVSFLVGVAPAAQAQECGCDDTGAYKSPATEAIVTGATSPGDKTYSLSTSQTATQATLTIRRAAGNAVVQSFTVPLSRLAYGWSPDGDRFVVRHGYSGSTTMDQVVLWDLDADRRVLETTMRAGAATAFSPHGKWFLLNQLLSPGQAQINVWNASTPGPAVLDAPVIFSNVPGGGADSFGSIGTGFSSEDDDRSFVYAYRATNGSTQLTVRNLATRVDVVNTSLTNGTGAFWRFSPCGDSFGIVSQPLANTASVRLHKTASVGALGSEKSFSPVPATIALETTATKHRIKTTSSGGSVSYTNVADNAAATACAQAPTLSSLSLNRTGVTGGTQHATATLTLTSAAASAMTATLSSSDTSAATVPSSLTISRGSTSRTFTVTSKTVTSQRTVVVSATVAGVTKTAELTVNPAAPPQQTSRVRSLSVTPSTVTGGQTGSATVTLDVPAPAGGAVVGLSSSNPAVAAVPSSTTVPAGQTSHSFVVTTSPVTSDAQATLTAGAGGGTGTASLTVRAQQQTTSPEAVVQDAACTAETLPRNDDGSTDAVPLPFQASFFGVTFDHLYVNNNGNVTVGSRLSTYTPFRITASTPPIIAPFLADVDTRGQASRQVTYSSADAPATFAGRPAFCVNWVDVGYYPNQADKLNSAQLLLVDRSDVAPGDFDIVMNYDRISWETGSASGGSGGFGGSSAGAGYSAGTGDPNAFYEFPGTLVNGALLDSNPDTGLTRTSRGTLQLGRHVFEVRGGAAPTGATLRGLVADASGTPLGGAPVQVCADSVCRAFTSTGSSGRYQAPGLPAGDYTVTVRPPAGSTLNPSSVPVTLPEAGVLDLDVTLTGPVAPPDGTSVSPSWKTGQGIPGVYWGDTLDLDTTACPGGTGTWQVQQGGSLVAEGELSEGEPGRYSGQIPPLRPVTGLAQLVLSVECPDGSQEETAFDLYIDPSGTVRTPSGAPVPDALVTLYRADNEAGPFVAVQDGSAVMSPTNRVNPMLTDGDGRFGWDTVAGYYVVRAERAGCTALDGAAYVETPVLPVPPEWTDLDLRLDCPDLDVEPEDATAPQVDATATPTANGAGWHRDPVTVTISATDAGEPATGVARITWSMTGAQADQGETEGGQATLEITEDGVTTVAFTATDGAGNTSEQGEIVIRLDRTAPDATCSADPKRLLKPNHRLVDVRVTVDASDATSGLAGRVLRSVSSNEADDGRGDGATTDDMQGWETGTPDTEGQLRAERSGNGKDRVYTLVYDVTDVAGNSVTCEATVSVPKGR